MRALPICLVALMLSGCSMLSRSPVEPVQSTAPQPKAEPAKPKAPRATPVRIYTNAEELVGKPFRDLDAGQNTLLPARNHEYSFITSIIRFRKMSNKIVLFHVKIFVNHALSSYTNSNFPVCLNIIIHCHYIIYKYRMLVRISCFSLKTLCLEFYPYLASHMD